MFRRLEQDGITLGFGTALVLVLVIGCLALVALRSVAASKDLLRQVSFQEMVDAHALRAALEAEVAASRGWMLGEPPEQTAERTASARRRVHEALARLSSSDHAALLAELASAEAGYARAAADAIAERKGGSGRDAVIRRYESEALVRRAALEGAFATLFAHLQGDLGEAERRSDAVARRHTLYIAAVTAFGLLLTALLGLALSGALGNARRQREEALARSREAAEQLDRLLANAPVGIAFLDRDLRYRRVNEPLARLAGTPAGALLGRPLDAGSVGALEPALRKVLETAEPLEGIELPLGGASRFALAHFFPLRSGGGVEGVGAVVLDISERKRHEEELQILAEVGALLSEGGGIAEAAPRLARLLVPRVADWCAVDLIEDGAIRNYGLAHREPERQRALAELYALEPIDISRPTAYGRAWVRGEPQLDAGLGSSSSGAGPDPWERALSDRLDASSQLVVPLHSRGWVVGSLSLGCARPRALSDRDLAFASEAGRRLSLAIENAELLQASREAVEARDEFLSIASHELRTPLTALLLRLEALRRKVGRAPALEEALAHARRQGEKMGQLLERLFDGAGLLTGRLRLERSRFDLADLARELAENWSGDARRAGCELRVEVESARGAWDRLRVEQAAANLVHNALKYGAGQPVELRVEVHGPTVRLTVRDHGPGIAPEHRERIFGRFERANAPRDLGGLGLGLYVARHIAEAHGGRIAVESEPGLGATFALELPRSAEADALEAA